MQSPAPLQYWNPYTQRVEAEKVYGDSAMRWLYTHAVGFHLLHHYLTGPFVSRCMGHFYSSVLSRPQIKQFISAYQIPMQEFVETSYKSFNDFFTRKFKEGMRPFVAEPSALPAPAEGRYLGFETMEVYDRFPVKGQALSARELLKNNEWEKNFSQGAVIIARLCPVDYHRFHFPDSGEMLAQYSVPGPLHSVNPFALGSHPNILISNYRVVSILSTDHFGKIAYIEVGALGVGKIIQTHSKLSRFSRGQEKGTFEFGASTIILLLEPGRISLRKDVVENSQKGLETFIKLGDELGRTKGND